MRKLTECEKLFKMFSPSKRGVLSFSFGVGSSKVNVQIERMWNVIYDAFKMFNPSKKGLNYLSLSLLHIYGHGEIFMGFGGRCFISFRVDSLQVKVQIERVQNTI